MTTVPGDHDGRARAHPITSDAPSTTGPTPQLQPAQLTSAERIQRYEELTELRSAMNCAYAQRDNEAVDRLDDRIFEMECLLGIAD